MPASCLIRFPIRRFTDYWKDATITGGPSYVHYVMGSPSPSLVPRNGPEASASPPVCRGFFFLSSVLAKFRGSHMWQIPCAQCIHLTQPYSAPSLARGFLFGQMQEERRATFKQPRSTEPHSSPLARREIDTLAFDPVFCA
jgi:hypothetical protein